MIGVGNRWCGDDAAGLEVVDRLRRAGGEGVAVELEGDPLELIGAWEGAEDVTIVDAVAGDSPAGTIHRLDASRDPLPAAFARASTHVFSVAEAIELARTLGRAPRRLYVYGIVGERFETGAAMTPAVERAVGTVASELLGARASRPGHR